MTSVSAQHVGFAIGPFEHVDLAEFRESEEDERLGQNAIPVHGFCLPGRIEEVKNTCLPIAKVGHTTSHPRNYKTEKVPGYRFYNHDLRLISIFGLQSVLRRRFTSRYPRHRFFVNM